MSKLADRRRAARTRTAVPGDAHPVRGAASPAGYPFPDLVAGYVTGYDPDRHVLDIRTSDDHPCRITITGATTAECLRNLGEPYLDAVPDLPARLVPGRHMFARGVLYPDGGVFAAGHIILTGLAASDFSFEKPGWWACQLRALMSVHRQTQFGVRRPGDFTGYRTTPQLAGEKGDGGRPETGAISRLVYGMACAYLLTGDGDHLDIAERGADYMRAHMRFADHENDVVYWQQGCDAISMHEQIYVLAGLTQLYRVTGDERIAADIDGTLRLFHRFFRDSEHGGYFSHLDPRSLSPHAESLGGNRGRKNWDSIGGHAPAYLINLYLATGERRHAAMLEGTYDLVVQHMLKDGSPFAREQFHPDWTPDRDGRRPGSRAVVSHNLKIAWNLMRIAAITAKPSYRELAERIGWTMPGLDSDRQRGGWQREEAILAYQVLAGCTGEPEFRRRGREAAAFYNAFFLNQGDGGVHHDVLADGTPYPPGPGRARGRRSMSAHRSAELCYLATVYQQLLIYREPLTLWFRPRPDGFRRDRVLRVAPDAVPAGRVRLEWVQVDGRPYSAYDRDAMTIRLPGSRRPLSVRAHLTPST